MFVELAGWRINKFEQSKFQQRKNVRRLDSAGADHQLTFTCDARVIVLEKIRGDEYTV
jgi:hypothetical protein